MGRLPARDHKVSAQLVSTEDRGSYTLEKLVLDLNGQEPVPAYFAAPKGGAGKRPTVLFNHSHGGGYKIGKAEFIDGREYLAKPSYAEFLTSLGYNALCIDAWIFGERSGRTELDMFKDMIWQGRVLWGMMVYDSLKAIDYLTTRPTWTSQGLAQWAFPWAVLAQCWVRWIRAWSGGRHLLPDRLHTLVEVGGLKGHGIYYYLPDLLTHSPRHR